MTSAGTASDSRPLAAGAVLLQVQGLQTSFDTPRGTARALRGVDLAVAPSEIVGLVGESGCGKSVLALSILGLLPQPAGRVEAGRVEFEGLDLLALSARAMRRVRGNRIGMVFQDPMSSLNPYLTVGDQVAEPLCTHGKRSRKEARREAIELLREVGIPDAVRRADEHPHRFSGGMRQRVMIAMALAMRPALLIADEPTTSLDVTIQAQILALLSRIRDEHGTAILLITHDLGVVAGCCDRVDVIYAGEVVESAPTDRLFRSPCHPYTQALLKSSPSPEIPRRSRLFSIPGQPPALTGPLPGCAFAPRCRHRRDECVEVHPALRTTGAASAVTRREPTRAYRCLFTPAERAADDGRAAPPPPGRSP